MTRHPFLSFAIALLVAAEPGSARAEIPGNLRDENVVAWCIVPFDAKRRGPEERAAMLETLGIRRCAYDWRQEHVPTFEREILEYRKRGIEFFAFWGSHEEAFALFRKYDLHPQIWQTAPAGEGATDEEKIASAAKKLEPLAKRTAELGCALGLYNHGGWGGEPANLVAVCEKLRALGYGHVGIVYNFHHGHGHIDDWPQSFARMKPYLLCLNLDGMAADGEAKGRKILPLAQGDRELDMLRVVVESGYAGPVGILDHRPETDTAETLHDNLDGLGWLRKELEKPGSGGPKPKPRAPSAPPKNAAKAAPPPPVAAESLGPAFGKALRGGLTVPAREEFRQPPFTVECRARLDSKKNFNILVACDTKASSSHWEIFSMRGDGRLTAYFPGLVPDHIRSEADICDGRWHAIAMRVAPGEVVLWLDGKPVATRAVAPKPGGKRVPGDLAFGRLVEGGIGCDGAIDEARITRGLRDDLARVPTTPAGADSSQVIGYWNFDDLAEAEVFDRKPLEPDANPYWREFINRDRVYDFYAKQARQFGSLEPERRPKILPQFPGLDGGSFGHWGNQNDDDTWADDRVRGMDHGAMVSGVFRGAGKTFPRGVSVRLGGGLNAVFNTRTLAFEAAWSGDLAKWSDRRRGFMQGTPMGGEALRSAVVEDGAARAGDRYLGLYRHGERVIFSYERDGRRWLDSVSEVDGKLVRLRESEGDGSRGLADLVRGGPSQWPERLMTHGTLGEGSPHAIDTLALPHENPWKALLFVGGVDFLSATRIAVCTIHGDVWLCDMDGEDLKTLTWKRFAAGLHQPLGLKVSDGVVHAMCRDQIVALHDLNGDDEADFYECVSNAHVTSPGGHDFITGLERDEAGRWYFASGNQGLCRVSADGGSVEALATGFRNPNGLGISPDGGVILTGVQEGDWTPASAVCEVTKGGHYGAGGPGDGPLGYLPPMLYLPRGVDNSCGGQTFIDSDRWGPVKGSWLHFSGGFCTHFLVLREVLDGHSQAAAIALPGEFLSGSHRARFSPFDGQLYVVGAQGWGNYGTRDGSLQRVRFTGAKAAFPYPIAYETHDNGILLTFAGPVTDAVADAGRWFAQQWNYVYGPAYGSPEYSVRDPRSPGHDPLEIRSVHRLGDGSRLFVEIPQLLPSSQLHLHCDAAPRLEIFATPHRLGEPFADFPGYTAIPKETPDPAAAGPVEAAPNPWTEGPAGRPVVIRAALGLRYETRRFTVKRGERISLTLDNPDTVPHNLVLAKPGTLKKLGDLANRLLADPNAFRAHYVPDSPEVLAHTSLVMPAESETIHFTAPDRPGGYPYLCTFPGHWMVMNGVMVVE
ncbi:MAG: heme-binding domain-containing protein [Akkermansiaceae bacterium]|nr:heme-binding domain-containing protein [Akkermansiaceae bacterium]